MSEFEPIMQQKLGDILVNLVGSKIKKNRKGCIAKKPTSNQRQTK